MIKISLSPGTSANLESLGLLILRLAVGAQMAALHGWAKLQNYSSMSEGFPDPLGVSPHLSLGLAIFGEFFCGILVAIGLWTRLAIIPLIITMAVAFFIIHGGDPWAKRELAMMYLAPSLTILFCGPGRFSVEGIFKK